MRPFWGRFRSWKQQWRNSQSNSVSVTKCTPVISLAILNRFRWNSYGWKIDSSLDAIGYLISIWWGSQWILGGQHGGGNHNANQYHVAEVTVIAEPMAKHAKPAKRDRKEIWFRTTSAKATSEKWIEESWIERAIFFISYLVGAWNEILQKASVPISAWKNKECRTGRDRFLLGSHVVLGHSSRSGRHFLICKRNWFLFLLLLLRILFCSPHNSYNGILIQLDESGTIFFQVLIPEIQENQIN